MLLWWLFDQLAGFDSTFQVVRYLTFTCFAERLDRYDYRFGLRVLL